MQTATAININNQAFLEEAAQAFIYVNTKCPHSLLFILKREENIQKTLELCTHTLLIYYTTLFYKHE